MSTTKCTLEKLGFGAFTTRESKEFDVDPLLTSCNNISCENEAFVEFSQHCGCGTVHYCSRSCKIEDSDHECHICDPNVTYCDGDTAVRGSI